MEPHKKRKIRSDEEPVQQQIVVAPEDSTERPSQQQLTGKSHDRPVSLQVQNASIKPLGQDQREPQKSDDRVCTIGPGKGTYLPPSDKQTPSKTARPAKATSKWCDDCIVLKTKPGENGRTRRNARYGCPKCAKLKEEAGLQGKKQAGHSSTPNGQGIPPATQARPKPGDSRSAPKKPLSLSSTWQKQNPGETAQSVKRKEWKLAVPSKPRQKQNGGFDPGTESDDSDNPPKPNVSTPLVDIFGTPQDYSEYIRRTQGNYQGWNAQPSAAAVPRPDFVDEYGQPIYLNSVVPAARGPHQVPAVSGAMQASGPPVQTVTTNLNLENPTQVVGQPGQPSLYEFTSSLATNNASGPQQQQSEERSGAFSLFPPVPSPSLGEPRNPNATQIDAGVPIFSRYPEPWELKLLSHFNHARGNTELSNASEAVSPMDFEYTGGPSSRNTTSVNTRFSNTFEATFPAPSDLSSMPGPADPAPANPPASRRHPGLQPWSIDPMLTGEPYQPLASPSPVPSVSSATINNQTDGELGTEEDEDMLEQDIN